jgi:hypothetical protein
LSTSTSTDDGRPSAQARARALRGQLRRAGLFERIEAHVAVPERGTKFRTKRQADAVARLLADHGHEIEWVRKNYGAQRESTWNVRLTDGSEVPHRRAPR